MLLVWYSIIITSHNTMLLYIYYLYSVLYYISTSQASVLWKQRLSYWQPFPGLPWCFHWDIFFIREISERIFCFLNFNLPLYYSVDLWCLSKSHVSELRLLKGDQVTGCYSHQCEFINECVGRVSNLAGSGPWIAWPGRVYACPQLLPSLLAFWLPSRERFPLPCLFTVMFLL